MDKSKKEFNILSEELIDEIGEYVGLKMWNNRDKSKEYDFPGAREDQCSHGDEYAEGYVVLFKSTQLLVYKNKNCFHGFKSLYTLNLLTLKPTTNSHIKTVLSKELVEKIKTSTKCRSNLSNNIL